MNHQKLIQFILNLITLGLIAASIYFYYTSLFKPAVGSVYFGADSQRYLIYTGLQALYYGWLGVLVMNVAWFANVFYLISFIVLLIWLIQKLRNKKIKTIRTISIIFLYLSFFNIFLSLNTYLLLLQNNPHGPQRGGVYAGFYLWVLSFILLSLTAILIRWRSGRDSNPRPPA